MLLKSVKTKKQAVQVMEEMKPYLNAEGNAVVDYYISEIKSFKVGELKKGIQEDFTKEAELYRDWDGKMIILDMLYGERPQEDDAKVEESKVEKTDKGSTKDKGTKDDSKKSDKNVVTENDIIKLVGYRYTRPIFPEVIQDETLFEGNKLVRVDTENIAELEKIGLDNLIVATYFPTWENQIYVDPVGILDKDYHDILKDIGKDAYPFDLDLGYMYYLNATTKTMVHVSLYTGIPYAVSIKPQWFKVDKLLQCRVNNFGHDYAIYKLEATK